MKKKDLENHKTKPVTELEKELKSQHEKLNGLRFDLAAGKVKDIREIRNIRKSIAQLLTLKKQISK
ncbi:MAG: 50S ribosomal protein L29 [Minisyncoccia bacterium]